MGVYSELEEIVYAALSAINKNTSPSYPPGLFSDSEVKLTTVYEVECSTAVTIQGVERRVSVMIRADHFAGTRADLNATADAARAAITALSMRCTTDKTSKTAGGLYRRSQSFTCVYDAAEKIIYEGGTR